MIDEGGMWRKPGPILRGEAFGGTGKMLGGIISPGRTTVSVAIPITLNVCLDFFEKCRS